MKIYIAHSREFDYQTELYTPIREDTNLPQDDIILPHEPSHDPKHSRDFYRKLDLMIAEVSYPATGLGIELGWAADDQVPIYAVTDHVLTYSSSAEMLNLIEKIIQDVRK